MLSSAHHSSPGLGWEWEELSPKAGKGNTGMGREAHLAVHSLVPPACLSSCPKSGPGSVCLQGVGKGCLLRHVLSCWFLLAGACPAQFFSPLPVRCLPQPSSNQVSHQVRTGPSHSACPGSVPFPSLDKLAACLSGWDRGQMPAQSQLCLLGELAKACLLPSCPQPGPA